ncbi:DUF397 domain-containing protein [Actinokineospora sp.]|uniref:DUF397 domain-containing protein n=1 Tax=Actinokineospora sp. TaxID=1872133 RepID=UPI004037894D
MDLTSARWRKSSRSGSETDCVEIAHVESEVAVRDSKNPRGGHLAIPTHALHHLTHHATQH